MSGLVPHQDTVPAAEGSRNARPALAFRDLTKTYYRWRGASVRALNGFSLEVRRGEIMGFLGPNGAGKTTAMHIALGLIRPSSGAGELLGCAFGDKRARRRIGFVPEYIGVPQWGAKRIVHWAGMLNSIPHHVTQQRADALLAQLELPSGRNVKGFSRGMMQRVGIAQALVNDPELLILDEPTSALDPAGRVLVRDVLLRRRAQGKTVFLSSHLLSEVEEICDRVAIVVAGRVICTGKQSDLLMDEAHFEIEADVDGQRLTQTVDAVSQRSAIEAIWSRGGSVLSVRPLRRTLEEVFLRITKPS